MHPVALNQAVLRRPDHERVLAAGDRVPHQLDVIGGDQPIPADTVAEVANLVDTSDPRGLLAKAIPDCPARLYRALDTAGNKVQPHSFYQRLSSACRGPFGTELLNGKLSDERLGFYEAIQTMDPLVANLRTAMPEMPHVAEAVNTLISMIRSYGALSECDMTLPKNARRNPRLRRFAHQPRRSSLRHLCVSLARLENCDKSEASSGIASRA